MFVIWVKNGIINGVSSIEQEVPLDDQVQQAASTADVRPVHVEDVWDEEERNIHHNDRQELEAPEAVVHILSHWTVWKNQDKDRQVVDEQGERHHKHGFNTVAAACVGYGVATRVNALVPVPFFGAALQGVQHAQGNQHEEHGFNNVPELWPRLWVTSTGGT